MDRTTLRALIEAGRARFDETLAGFSDAAMLERIDDEWTRKDVVAHVEAWERRVVQLFEALRVGGATDESYETTNSTPSLPARPGPVARHVRPASGGARRDARGARWRRRGALRRHAFRRTNGDRFADWFRANGDEHYDEHLGQLTRPAR